MSDFIRLQLKLKWGLNRNNNKKSAVMTAIAAIFAVAVALALVGVLTYVLKFNLNITAKKLSQLYLTLVMFALTVYATGLQLGRLYRPGDIHITARFPLSPFKLFVSYLIINYIELSVYSVVLLVPIMLVFGYVMSCLSVVYILGILIGALLMPILPFALSIFIAIPVMYAVSFLERNPIVRLILFVVFLAGCFVLYNYILTVLAQFFIHRNWETGTLEIWDKILAALDSYYNPAYYLGNTIFFEEFWLGLGVIVGAGVLLGAGGIFLAKFVYSGVRKKVLEGGETHEKTSSTDEYGSTRAMLRYSFREILRTKTSSYFYLGVAISTPVMVFFCNRLVTIVGEAQIGTGINFGASMLVISVFMAMICSFTGTILSIEGKNFYITKLVPVPYRKQLLIKGLLNVCVGLMALAISVAVLCALQFLNPQEMATLVVTQIMLVVGLVFNGINLNLSNPNLKPKANGEAEEINITYMFIIGLAVSAVLGASSLVFPRVISDGGFGTYSICIAVTFVYQWINVLVYWFTVDKKYRKIEA